MTWSEEQFTWIPERAPNGKEVRLGLTRHGTGPLMLMLPALSSIAMRQEMRGLQQELGAQYTTLAVDWPGFGTQPRPAMAWAPRHFTAFLRDLLAHIGQPDVTLAAGHASGYALQQAARAPGSLGRLALLSPTWRGPLPTMARRRLAAFDLAARAVDLPVIGNGLYRLNVNGPVIGLMARGHVYQDPAWLSDARMAEKRQVTEAPGARHAAFRFVTGALDLFHDRESWLQAAAQAGPDLLSLSGPAAPRKSAAEMAALAALPNVRAIHMPQGKLSFYEEFPTETALALIRELT